ncbi:MAG: cytochrome C oxidase subunit IV family protein [Fimbriimonadaceae bacterium]
MSNKSPVGAHHHITPVWKYAATLGALLLLMAMTILAAKVQFPGGTLTNNIVAMAIALTKASLVVLIFMGVAYTTKLAKLWAVVGFLWLFFLFGVLVDYKARGVEPVAGFHNDAGSALKMGGANHLSHTPGDNADVVTPGAPKGG